MNEYNNIPEAGESWEKAEKMLDRHFKNRRIIFWLVYVAIPLGIIGIGGFYFLQNSERAKASITKSVTLINDASNSSLLNKKIIAPPLAIEKSKADVSSQLASHVYVDPVNTNCNKGDKKHLKTRRSAESKSGDVLSAESNSPAVKHETFQQHLVKNNIDSDSRIKSSLINSKTVSKNNNYISSEIKINSQEKTTAIASKIEDDAWANNNLIQHTDINREVSGNSEFAFLPSHPAHLDSPVAQNDVTERKDNSIKGSEYPHTGWEISFYGGEHFNKKTLNTNDPELHAFAVQRKDGEEGVLLPSFGIAVSADIRLWSVTLGAEYHIAGERTDYYPYSNQMNINQNVILNVITTSSVDIDTAYITGNQYFLHTILYRQDSIYETISDTVIEYKFDKNIESNNGINKISYFEIPLELTYYLAKGKAGIGLTGGISAGFLSGSKGHYLKSLNSGVINFEEISSFRKVMMNARLSLDFYYRTSARTKITLRPQFRTNLNSVFKNDYSLNQKYYSTGILFGVSYMLN